ncbi:MAG: hypothetical protein K6G62_02770 [Eubacterium sp.]|nr:hypothetical protein [Eubacterium sp.]
MITMIGWTVFSLAAYGLFGLYWYASLALFVLGLPLIWVAEGVKHKGLWEREKFHERMDYLEQLLCSYRRQGMVSLALKDCLEIFAGRPLENFLQEAIKGLEEGQEEKAFSGLEKNFGSRRMVLIHDFLLDLERRGGQGDRALDILLTDLQKLKNRVLLRQGAKERLVDAYQKSMILAGLLAYCSGILVPSSILPQIRGNAWYQAGFVLLSLVCLLGNYLAKVYGYRGWQEEEAARGDWKVRRAYSLFLLRVCVNLTFLNSYQAIEAAKSPGLEKEKAKLLEDLNGDPGSVRPFMEFARTLGRPEVETGMRLLYAVREHGLEGLEGQIYGLLDHCNLVMEDLEKNSSKASLLPLQLIRQVPMGLATLKIGLDLFLFLGISMQELQLFL